MIPAENADILIEAYFLTLGVVGFVLMVIGLLHIYFRSKE